MSSPRGIRAGRAFVELGVNDRITAALRRVQAQLRAFGAAVRQTGIRLAAVGTAGTAAFGLMTRQFVSAGDELDKLSARTGVSVEALSELQFVASQTGTSIESLGSALFRMRRRLANATLGTGPAVRALQELGLSAEGLSRVGVERQFTAIVDALSGIENESLKAQFAFEIFGDNARALVPLLDQGAEGIDALREQARRLGLTISTDAARQASELSDQLDVLRAVVRRTRLEIGAALAPAVQLIASRASDVAVTIREWVGDNRELVRTVAAVTVGILGLGTVLIVTGTAVTVLSIAVAGLAKVIGLVGASIGLALSPIGALTTAIAGVGAIIVSGTEAGRRAISRLQNEFWRLKDTTAEVVEAVATELSTGNFEQAARVAWLGVRVAWREATDDLRSITVQLVADVLRALAEIDLGVGVARRKFEGGFERATTGGGGFLLAAGRFAERVGLEIEGVLRRGELRLFPEQAREALGANLDAELDERRRQLRQRGEDQRATQDILTGESRERQERQIERLVDQFRDRESDIEAGRDLALQALQRRLEEQRRELDEAIAASRDRRATGPEEDGATGRARSWADELEDILAGLNTRVESFTRGTFNAAALQGLQTSPVAERTARAAEQTAKAVTQLERNSREGGLHFA